MNHAIRRDRTFLFLTLFILFFFVEVSSLHCSDIVISLFIFGDNTKFTRKTLHCEKLKLEQKNCILFHRISLSNWIMNFFAAAAASMCRRSELTFKRTRFYDSTGCWFLWFQKNLLWNFLSSMCNTFFMWIAHSHFLPPLEYKFHSLIRSVDMTDNRVGGRKKKGRDSSFELDGKC